MEKYKKKLEELNSDEEFVYNFTREQELEMIKNTEIELAMDEGVERGIERGVEQRNIEVAKSMLNENQFTDEMIMKITGLTQEELENLKK